MLNSPAHSSMLRFKRLHQSNFSAYCDIRNNEIHCALAIRHHIFACRVDLLRRLVLSLRSTYTLIFILSLYFILFARKSKARCTCRTNRTETKRTEPNRTEPMVLLLLPFSPTYTLFIHLPLILFIILFVYFPCIRHPCHCYYILTYCILYVLHKLSFCVLYTSCLGLSLCKLMVTFSWFEFEFAFGNRTCNSQADCV